MMPTKRVSPIDQLRGFSLLGILLANLLIFQYGIVGKDELSGLSLFDEFAYYFTKIFIEYSFMPIFTILFGYSLIKLVESTRLKSRKSRWILIRRSIGLITLGLLHSMFLWEGDILFFYGSMLLLLFPFINRSAKTLFIMASVILLASIFLSCNPNLAQPEPSQKELYEYINQANKVYANGSYNDIYDFRNNVMIPGLDSLSDAIIAMIFSFFSIMPLFLIGMAFAKLRLFENLRAELKLYQYGSILIPVGIALKLTSMVESTMQDILITVGGEISALGYVFLFMWIVATNKWPKAMHSFEQVGKLSLSNYLAQTVICTSIFYGYGLGLFGKLGVFIGLFIGIVIFVSQCFISTWYLNYLKRGPVEILLRIWTNFSFKR